MAVREPQEPEQEPAARRQDGRGLPEPVRAELDFFVRRAERRREKIVAEIQANRRGEYTVPTWVLVLALVAMVGGIAALLAFL